MACSNHFQHTNFSPVVTATRPLANPLTQALAFTESEVLDSLRLINALKKARSQNGTGDSQLLGSEQFKLWKQFKQNPLFFAQTLIRNWEVLNPNEKISAQEFLLLATPSQKVAQICLEQLMAVLQDPKNLDRNLDNDWGTIANLLVMNSPTLFLDFLKQLDRQGRHSRAFNLTLVDELLYQLPTQPDPYYQYLQFFFFRPDFTSLPIDLSLAQLLCELKPTGTATVLTKLEPLFQKSLVLTPELFNFYQALLRPKNDLGNQTVKKYLMNCLQNEIHFSAPLIKLTAALLQNDPQIFTAEDLTIWENNEGNLQAVDYDLLSLIKLIQNPPSPTAAPVKIAAIYRSFLFWSEHAELDYEPMFALLPPLPPAESVHLSKLVFGKEQIGANTRNSKKINLALLTRSPEMIQNCLDKQHFSYSAEKLDFLMQKLSQQPATRSNQAASFLNAVTRQLAAGTESEFTSGERLLNTAFFADPDLWGQQVLSVLARKPYGKKDFFYQLVVQQCEHPLLELKTKGLLQAARKIITHPQDYFDGPDLSLYATFFSAFVRLHCLQRHPSPTVAKFFPILKEAY